MEKDVDGYIKLAITDIARKCNVKEKIVINHMKICVGLET